jgi:Protein of unknown function (DUF3606)
MRKPRRASYDQDYRRIDLRHSGDIRYWAVMLNCSVGELKKAVLLVGPVVCDVDNYLRRMTMLGFRA